MPTHHFPFLRQVGAESGFCVMKTIGVIGGLSPQSTITYYREICEGVRRARGGLSGPPLLVASVDQQEILELREAGRWERVGEILSEAAQALERGGAECVLIACNSVHKVAETVEKSISVPFLHIVDATAAGILAKGVGRIGLLGTRYSMEMGFYQERLRRFGIEAIVPEKPVRDEIHRIIFEELCIGLIRPESKKFFLEAAWELSDAGAGGLVLGCTEIDLIIGPEDFPFPVFDSTALHIERATAFVLDAAVEISVTKARSGEGL